MAAPSLAPLRRWDPERIGPYTVLGRLGAGAMGQVYLGRSRAGRLVAVKTIKIEFAEEAGFRARFAHEVAAARRVSGVFTASVVAADADADVPWLATAFVPAPSLDTLVRACGPLPVPGVRWLAAGCAEALESIHGAGLVHRDLKPSNVLVSPDGPRVIDFGLARAAERIQLTVTHGAVGTPAYMAPEQARDTRQASVASDVFSLGATLVFAATGHPPYQGETVMDILVRLATEPPDLTGLPTTLEGLVTACLERSPRRRPSAAALLGRLGQFGEATSGPDGSHSYLSEQAATLIAGYQRSPVSAPGAPDGDAGDATFGSHLALPLPGTAPPGEGSGGQPPDPTDPPPDPANPPPHPTNPPPHPANPPPHPANPPPDPANPPPHPANPPPDPADPPPAPDWAPAGTTRQPGSGGRAGAVLMTVAVAAAAVVLVAVGALAGRLLDGPAQHTNGNTGSFPPGPPPGVPPGPPPTALPTGRSTRPEVVLNQAFGDGATGFVIHGSGWQPQTRVSVALAGHSSSPIHPLVDMMGTFNYVINSDHEFFAGLIPPGNYQVVVTGAGGRRASARFSVNAPPPGGPPSPGAPPATSPPSG
jgi:serine/threonine protein kinase